MTDILGGASCVRVYLFWQRNLLGSGRGLTLVPPAQCLDNNKGVLAPSGGSLCGGDAVIVGSPGTNVCIMTKGFLRLLVGAYVVGMRL